jgi:hypothetical protein
MGFASDFLKADQIGIRDPTGRYEPFFTNSMANRAGIGYAAVEEVRKKEASGLAGSERSRQSSCWLNFAVLANRLLMK